MPSCEKCWNDARNPFNGLVDVEVYHRLLKERDKKPCSPREQAGDWWDEETQSDTRIKKEQDPAHEK